MGTLRLMLALAVASNHSPYGPLPGFRFALAFTAVQSFFVISGFFITMVLNENLAYGRARTFYASRYLRLWPMYIVCALPTLLLNQSNSLSFKDYGHSYFEFFGLLDVASKLFILFSNLTLVFQDWFLFLQIKPEAATLAFAPLFTEASRPPAYAFLWIGQGWSLGIEFVFYLIAPFIARSPARLVALVAIGLASRYASYRYFGEIVDPWYCRFVISEMALFGLGGLGYYAYARLGWPNRVVRLVGVAALVIAILLAGFRYLLGPLGTVLQTGFAPLMLWDPVTLIFMVLFVPAIFAATRKNAVDRFLGDLSYPIYLCQAGIGALLTSWAIENPTLGTMAYVAGLLVASLALIVLIDAPVTMFRSRRLGAQAHAAMPVPLLG